MGFLGFPRFAMGTYYLREVFGPVCPALQITSRKPSAKMKKRPCNIAMDKRMKDPVIEVKYLEQVTTAAVSEFISSHVRSRGIAPKTANRHREILHTLFNWAMKEGGVRMPADTNPVSDVKRYKEKAPQIRFLTLKQIDEQLEALQELPQLQTMVALYIYAGLRREEALWLTLDDVDPSSGPHGIIRVRAKGMEGESWQPKTSRTRSPKPNPSKATPVSH